MKEDVNDGALDAMNKHVEQVSVRVNALKERVKAAGYGTGDDTGKNSLLQLKTAVLLRYTANLVAFAALRVEGKPLDDELRGKLCADWATLDRIRPLEKRLRPQLDALVKAHNETDNHRPNPAAMLNASDSDFSDDDDGNDDSKKADVYVPPKFTETVYADNEETTARIRADKQRKTKERMLRSEGTKAMLAELRGLPEEIRDSTPRQSKTVADANKGRDRFEEDNFIRLARTKKDRKSQENAIKQAAIADGDYGMDGLLKLADGVSRKIKNTSAKANGSEKGNGNSNRTDDEMEKEQDFKERALAAMYGSGESGKKRKKRKSNGDATPGKKRRA